MASLFDSISQLRRDYGKDNLNIDTLDTSPFNQFGKWMEDALAADFLDPNAMALSTSDADGRPSSRIVLLKAWDEKGFIFYSNFESRKGREMDENPQACLLFFWDKLERQIRISGRIEKISDEESDKYFQSRDYVSRLGAWASEQSRPLSSRFTLMRRVARLALKYPKNVPLPPFWGGYRLLPDEFEFWQGRESRLHDRFKYLQRDGKWDISRLNP